jgi:GT2 family glycosyltransferase
MAANGDMQHCAGERPAAVQLRLPQGLLRAGWLEIEAELRTLDGCAEVQLLLNSGAGETDTVAYALPVFAGETVSQVLHSPAEVVGARLTCASVSASFGRAELRAIGRLRLMRRGWQISARETLSAVAWRLVGKKVRARNILRRLLGQPRRIAYQAWLARDAARRAADRDAMRLTLAAAIRRPKLSAIVLCHGAQSDPVVASLGRQIVLPDEIILVDPRREGASSVVASYVPTSRAVASLCDAVASATGDWLIVLSAWHLLADDALLFVAGTALRAQSLGALYWDSDTVDETGQAGQPELKPQWNEALFLARDYVGAVAVSRDAFERGRSAFPSLPLDVPDALLLTASMVGDVVHIQHVLDHQHAGGCEWWGTSECAEARRVLVEAYARIEVAGVVACRASHGNVRLRYPLPVERPLVSLIVPTRDRRDLLEACIEGLMRRTTYPRLEILIADNGSTRPDTQAYFDDIVRDARVRVIDCSGPFNFSDINNRAVANARGTVLGFINNDVEVIGPEWLEEMVSQALRPGIGAVGARLLYASGQVQHGGVLLGVGGYAGHAHRFADPREPGYLSRLQAHQYFMAVTAACLVVERRKFEAVGGFDADAFPVAYNDVDLCLRLRAAGFETLWTPYAELFHKESASRVKDYSTERQAAYHRECLALIERWDHLISDDPFYHPALSRTLENFSLD